MFFELNADLNFGDKIKPFHYAFYIDSQDNAYWEDVSELDFLYEHLDSINSFYEAHAYVLKDIQNTEAHQVKNQIPTHEFEFIQEKISNLNYVQLMNENKDVFYDAVWFVTLRIGPNKLTGKYTSDFKIQIPCPDNPNAGPETKCFFETCKELLALTGNKAFEYLEIRNKTFQEKTGKNWYEATDHLPSSGQYIGHEFVNYGCKSVYYFIKAKENKDDGFYIIVQEQDSMMGNEFTTMTPEEFVNYSMFSKNIVPRFFGKSLDTTGQSTFYKYLKDQNFPQGILDMFIEDFGVIGVIPPATSIYCPKNSNICYQLKEDKFDQYLKAIITSQMEHKDNLLELVKNQAVPD